MNDEPHLAVENLFAGYGDSEIIKGISLEVEKGEPISILGRNGVGKTTTLRCIIGSLTPTSGSIRFEGEELVGLDISDRVRKGMTLVPEDRRVFPDLTVEENLTLSEYGADLDRGELRTKEEIYDLFDNLSERRNAKGSTLSGGEQQMLVIAQALLTGADLIMLDEPTEGLAPVIVEDLVEVLERLKETGCTLIIVEQNLEVALSIANRNYIVDKGTVVFEGTSEEISDNKDVVSQYLSVET